MSFWARPILLYSAISRIVSIDSFLAGSMKLHVLTTSTSAWSGCCVSSCPRETSSPIMTSLSTRFLGQPKLTNPTFNDLLSAEEFLLYRIAGSGSGQDCAKVAHSEPRHSWSGLATEGHL